MNAITNLECFGQMQGRIVGGKEATPRETLNII